MATTVGIAFNEFIRDKVNLDPEVTQKARDSRDNLLSNIAEFDNEDGFFDLCDSFNVHFGSFARRTKCRELDDIDIMIGISANGGTYFSHSWDVVTICASTSNQAQIDCTDLNGNLNSTKVINKFKKKLEYLRDYSRSEVKRSGEAVVLNLLSRDWSFDIVPCFHTVKENDGRSYYLIPNGNGGWKKTDPTIDRKAVQRTNQVLNGKVLELIRLVKRWNKTKKSPTSPSYLLEAILINYCSDQTVLSDYMDIRFKDALLYIANNITNTVNDPKNIQGNINSLSYFDQITLSQKALTDYNKACEALEFETQERNQEKSIKKWGEIFGKDFPTYG